MHRDRKLLNQLKDIYPLSGNKLLKFIERIGYSQYMYIGAAY